MWTIKLVLCVGKESLAYGNFQKWDSDLNKTASFESYGEWFVIHNIHADWVSAAALSQNSYCVSNMKALETFYSTH